MNRVTPRRFEAAVDPRAPDLRRDGFLRLPELRLAPGVLSEVRAYLEPHPVYNGHLPGKSDGVPRAIRAGGDVFAYGSYPEPVGLRCPHLVDLALHPTVLSLAESYLGCAPTLYSLNIWWSFAGKSSISAQDFHRDQEDHRFLALFVFLTDAPGGACGGQHEFIRRTHDPRWVAGRLGDDDRLAARLFPPRQIEEGYFQAPLYRRLFADQVETVSARAGEVFLADTWALHRGVPPARSDRLVCWIRLGLTGNIPFRLDPGSADSRVPLARPSFWHPYDRYVARVLINPVGHAH